MKLQFLRCAEELRSLRREEIKSEHIEFFLFQLYAWKELRPFTTCHFNTVSDSDTLLSDLSARRGKHANPKGLLHCSACTDHGREAQKNITDKMLCIISWKVSVVPEVSMVTGFTKIVFRSSCTVLACALYFPSFVLAQTAQFRSELRSSDGAGDDEKKKEEILGVCDYPDCPDEYKLCDHSDRENAFCGDGICDFGKESADHNDLEKDCLDCYTCGKKAGPCFCKGPDDFVTPNLEGFLRDLEGPTKDKSTPHAQTF